MRMFLAFIVALVTSVHLLTAAEPKPPIALRIMAAAAAFGKLGARCQSKGFFLPAWSCGREAVYRGDAEEFGLGDLEREPLVAFSADVGCCFATD